MNGWKEYLQKIRRVLLFCAICAAVLTIVLFLYDTPVEPVIYAMVLCAAAGVGALIQGHHSYMSKKENLNVVKDNFKLNLPTLSEPEDGNEKIYQELLRRTWNAKRRKTAKAYFLTSLRITIPCGSTRSRRLLRRHVSF